jgi:hypothetical protein
MDQALPARSSRPSQGEGEFRLQLYLMERVNSVFYPPSGRVAEEERRSGEGQQDLTTLAEGSATD